LETSLVKSEAKGVELETSLVKSEAPKVEVVDIEMIDIQQELQKAKKKISAQRTERDELQNRVYQLEVALKSSKARHENVAQELQAQKNETQSLKRTLAEQKKGSSGLDVEQKVGKKMRVSDFEDGVFEDGVSEESESEQTEEEDISHIPKDYVDIRKRESVMFKGTLCDLLDASEFGIVPQDEKKDPELKLPPTGHYKFHVTEEDVKVSVTFNKIVDPRDAKGLSLQEFERKFSNPGTMHHQAFVKFPFWTFQPISKMSLMKFISTRPESMKTQMIMCLQEYVFALSCDSRQKKRFVQCCKHLERFSKESGIHVDF
jgi:hypothetical protein